MKLFGPFYRHALRWAAHPHAPYYLAGLSAAEATFFPVPPDVMLAPMTVARPERGLRYALLCTAASVLGGLLGYAIGYAFLEALTPTFERLGWLKEIEHGAELFDRHGFWIILLAGFSPIPYKVFTIAAGMAGMPLAPFLLGSLAGRGGRFFLLASLLKWGAPRWAERIEQHIEWLGWAFVGLALAVILTRIW